MEYSSITDNGKTFLIQFRPLDGARRIDDIDFMVDSNLSGGIQGIEILDLIEQTKSDCVINQFPSFKDDEIDFSYDTEFDVVYVKINSGEVSRTTQKKGVVFLDSEGKFAGLQFEK